jgi:hypothetical protein
VETAFSLADSEHSRDGIIQSLPKINYTAGILPANNRRVPEMTADVIAGFPAQPIEEPAAWRPEDLKSDTSWVHRLSDKELDELNEALVYVRARGLSALELKRADFPLLLLSGRIKRIIHELEHGRGCVLLRGLDVAQYEIADLKTLYWGLGTHLGVPVSKNAKGDLIGQVTDSGREYEGKNVRGYTTNDAIRPHCDSSDIVSLLCVHHAKSGGESIISSSVTIFNEILKTRPEYLDGLAEGFYFDLRGEGASGNPDEVTRHKVPVFCYYDGRLSARFNQKTIEDGQRKAGAPLNGKTLDAVRYVGELALRDDVRFDMRFERGDIQILSNHTILHARNEFEDFPEPKRKRNLLRLWLNLRNGRKLPPQFAERLNTGPRGGVAVKGTDY